MTYNELISQVARYLKRWNDIDLVQMCGLAEGTNAATLKITAAIVYFLNNQQLSKAITDNIAMTACAQQAAGTFCYYLVSINASGTVVVTKGTDDTYALPATPFGYIPFSAFKIVTVAVTFTSGTTDLSAAGITATFYDIDTGIVASLINQTMRKLERGVSIIRNGKFVKTTVFEYMKARTTVALVAGDYVVTHPFANYKYKELVNAHIIDSDGKRHKELSRDGYNRCIELYPDFTNNVGRPVMITKIPTVESSLSPDIAPTLKWLLRPTCDASYTLDMTVYQYSPDLDGIIYASNWITLNAPEILLYGSLLEAMPYLKEPSRIPEFKEFYEDAVLALIANQKSEQFSGSAMRIKFDDPLNSGALGTYDINSGPY